MSQTETLNLQYLDRLVAQHVLGYEAVPRCKNWHREGTGDDWDWNYPKACHGGKCSPYEDSLWDPTKKALVWHMPAFSRDLEATVRVVAAMRKRGFQFMLADGMRTTSQKESADGLAQFINPTTAQQGIAPYAIGHETQATVLAALEAVGVRPDA